MTQLVRYRQSLPSELPFWAALVAVELLSIFAYLGFTNTTVSSYRYLVYPFLWINVALWAVIHTRPTQASRRLKAVALVASLAYLLALSMLSGLVELSSLQAAHSHLPSGLQVTMSAPGWGPRVFYTGAFGHLSFIPYRVIGYLALSYLLYVTILDVAVAAISALFGVASCIACSFPLVATLLAGVTGGSTGLVTSLSAYSLDISTVAFLLAVCLLYWRPGR
ncbi:DUF7546 family protein [Haladaptatus sp. ZSTT2]|uniref:DUF7546 family protein n=1 Tax=Haladaptatus sp. ZSTT2 TaxID=3120515 RepID=UPI00300F68AE